MKKIIFLMLFLFPAIAYGQNVSIDGYEQTKVKIIEFNAIPSTSTSVSNKAKIYLDSDDGKLKCSEDGGAYEDCVGGGSGSGDVVTVNSTGADTTANLLDNLYYDWALTDGGAGGPDDVTIKPDYTMTLAGNPALLVDECFWSKDTSGGFVICEGSTADTAEQLYRFPDVNGSDTTSYFMLDDASITGIDDTSLEINSSVLRRAALTGDVSASAGSNTTAIGNDKITEAMLKAVDAASDEECLTFETTTGDFEWQACGAGGATAWDDIGDPDADATIAFAGFEQTITSTLDEASHVALKIDHTDADVANATTLFQIQSVDDADASLTYMKIVDDSGGTPNEVFSIGADGATAMDGGLTVGGAITEGGNAVFNSSETPGGELEGTWGTPTIDNTGITLTSITIGALLGVDSIDATGAVDMDYGSADITDHTFTTDGGTVILDGVVTGDAFSSDVADPADAGVVRFGNAETACWEASPAGTDVCLSVSSAELFTMTNGLTVTGTMNATTVQQGGTGVLITGGALGTPSSGTLTNATGLPLAGTLITAGRSLTISTNDILADAELYTDTKCMTIETPTSADNFLFFRVPLASTITSIVGIVEAATSATFRIDECDTAGDNCAGIDGATTIVADVDGQADDGSLSNSGIDATDWLRLVVTATSGTPGHLTACVTFTKND